MVSYILYLILNFELLFGDVTSGRFSFVEKVVWKKSCTGVAKTKRNTAVTSSAPVPTSVCFSILMTGLT